MPKPTPTLRDLREGRGRPVPPPPYTQAQVEELALMQQGRPIDQTTLSKIERGQRRASPRLLFRLAAIYGVSYEFILLCAEETIRRAEDRQSA